MESKNSWNDILKRTVQEYPWRCLFFIVGILALAFGNSGLAGVMFSFLFLSAVI